MEIPSFIKAAYKAIITLVVIALVAGVLFSLSEGKSFGASLYWAFVTLTTVGYGDIIPITSAGRVVGVWLATTGLLLYGYMITIITTVGTKISLSEVFGMGQCKYKNHFVICGWTPVSEVVLGELLTAKKEVAVITETEDDIPTIKRAAGKAKVFAIYGDPSKIDILMQAEVKKARVVMLCMDDDTKNLITSLHVKKMNPRSRIIVKTTRGELRETMKISGVAYVSKPYEMSGRLIASAAFEPEVANFLEDITTATDVEGHDLRQYTLLKKEKTTVGKLSGQLREKTGVTLVAVGGKVEGTEEDWTVHPNPDDDFEISAGDIVILLGNREQFKKVKELLGTTQGR